MEHKPPINPFNEQEQYRLITETARSFPERTLEEIISARLDYLGLAEEEYQERYGKYERLEKAFDPALN